MHTGFVGKNGACATDPARDGLVVGLETFFAWVNYSTNFKAFKICQQINANRALQAHPLKC